MEEKGGVLHIFFIFVGIALLGLGIFYYSTDEKIKLDDFDNSNTSNTNTNIDDNGNKDEDKGLISQISLMKNVETSITLKNKKEVKITYLLDSDINAGKFIYDGKTAFNTESVELCDNFYIYNNSIISFCTSSMLTSNHLYVVDENGSSKQINSFSYNNTLKMLPKSITLKDGKLIVNGSSILEGQSVRYGDNDILLCENNEIKENADFLNLPEEGEFELKIEKEDIKFDLVNTSKTIKDFIYENCKIVE